MAVAAAQVRFQQGLVYADSELKMLIYFVLPVQSGLFTQKPLFIQHSIDFEFQLIVNETDLETNGGTEPVKSVSEVYCATKDKTKLEQIKLSVWKLVFYEGKERRRDV